MTTRPRTRPATSVLWLLRLVIACAIAGAGAGGSQASIIMGLDLSDLVRQADHIAVVEVASVQAAWDERHERIYSTINLTVIETWKAPSPPVPATGEPAARLTVVQPGGTVDDIRMTVTGMGTFTRGERSLVFLRGPANRAQVVGMTQGKRAIRFESVSRRWLVSPPDLRQAKLIRPTNGPNTGAPAPHATPVSSPSNLSSNPSSNLSSSNLKGSSAVPSSKAAVDGALAASGSRDVALEDMRAEIKRLLGAARP